MGDSIVGTTGAGADGSQVSPVLVGGLDSNGVARTFRVDTAGIVQTSYSTAKILTVQTGAPTIFVTPLVYDNTAVSGGLYGWDGAAYQKIGGLAS